MDRGLTISLMYSSICSLFFCFFVYRQYLSIKDSFLLSIVRILIPFVYFAFYFDMTWTFLDDISYLERGEKILNLGYNPITVLIDSEGGELLASLSGGRHTLYAWWNTLGQYLFGNHYYSTVFLNVNLVTISAYLFTRMMQSIGFNLKYCTFLFVFLNFHWDLVSWSSFVNLKDILVLTLTVIFFYSFFKIIKIEANKSLLWIYLSLILFSIVCLLSLRFYVPIGLFIAATAWLLLNKDKNITIISYLTSLILIIISMLAIISTVGLEEIKANISLLNLQLTSIIPGMFRFMLTPQPWSIEKEYGFLTLSSWLHWLMLVPAIWGATKLCKTFKELYLLILYLIVAIVLYGGFDELQGPRHRVQVSIIIALTQFHFLWLMIFGSTQSAPQSVGCDGGKKFKGRKRHI